MVLACESEEPTDVYLLLKHFPFGISQTVHKGYVGRENNDRTGYQACYLNVSPS